MNVYVNFNEVFDDKTAISRLYCEKCGKYIPPEDIISNDYYELNVQPNVIREWLENKKFYEKYLPFEKGSYEVLTTLHNLNFIITIFIPYNKYNANKYKIDLINNKLPYCNVNVLRSDKPKEVLSNCIYIDNSNTYEYSNTTHKISIGYDDKITNNFRGKDWYDVLNYLVHQTIIK